MSLVRPEVSNDLAMSLAKSLFGFSHISKLKELESFSDRNFYIKGTRIHNDQPGEFVLKVLNSLDSQEKEQLDAEIKASEFLRERGFPCPEIFSVVGADDKMPHVKLADGSPREISKTAGCVVRLIAFLPGDVVDSLERNPELMFTIGKLVGALSLQFKDFSHPGLKSRSEQNFRWDVLEIMNLEKYMVSLTDEYQIHLFREVQESFVSKVKPKLGEFRRGAVHNDLSGENLLVSKPPYTVTGVVDFGDTMESVLISELSNAMAFFMKGDRGIEFSGYILAGYQSVFPLSRHELELLYYFVAARLTQIALHSQCNVIKQPDDKSMQACLNKYFSTIRSFWSRSKEDVEKIWHVCEEKLRNSIKNNQPLNK
ncbi:hydroxylysine kinase-like [Actinia tenebrosa]|uniref:Hydroxylysine kinase n=1 Tax=Actinia tenebrosa TaxID=6105 RepID=A0A6P8IHU1_ACTTE|nr:hydroxylysine kinase-like [Actinia tenebrosa]